MVSRGFGRVATKSTYACAHVFGCIHHETSPYPTLALQQRSQNRKVTNRAQAGTNRARLGRIGQIEGRISGASESSAPEQRTTRARAFHADLPPLNVATFRESISGGANQGRARDATREEVHGGADHWEAPRGPQAGRRDGPVRALCGRDREGSGWGDEFGPDRSRRASGRCLAADRAGVYSRAEGGGGGRVRSAPSAYRFR